MRMLKLAFALLSAAAVMGMAVSSASANRLSVNDQRFRITWTELNFTEAVFGIGVHCPVTLEGSFHSATMSKVIGALIGHISRARVESERCRGGHATIPQETLPWHVTYEGFTGTLPRMTGIILLLRGLAVFLEIPPFGNCEARPANLKGTVRGAIEAFGAFKPETLNPGTETFPCVGTITIEGRLEGTGRITRLEQEARILVNLI